MQDKREQRQQIDDAPEPAGMIDDVRGSLHRPSHVWSNSKRNFVEDPEFEKLKASLARPDQVKQL